LFYVELRPVGGVEREYTFARIAQSRGEPRPNDFFNVLHKCYSFSAVPGVVSRVDSKNSSTAFAADLAVKAPVMKAPPAPVASWTGCYLGAGGGSRYYRRDHNEVTTATGVPNNISSSSESDGWFGTGQFGCDYQLNGSLVIGAFVDGDGSSITGNMELNGVAIEGRMKETSSWAAGGRIGYLVMPQLLTYVSGGWTEANWGTMNFVTNLGAPITDTLGSKSWNGAFVGFGTEYGLANFFPGLFWKNEVRYAWFNTQTNPFIPPNPNTTGLSDSSRLSSVTIRSELVWRFNSGPVSARY
jgi:outer membrane immunogenic protein